MTPCDIMSCDVNVMSHVVFKNVYMAFMHPESLIVLRANVQLENTALATHDSMQIQTQTQTQPQTRIHTQKAPKQNKVRRTQSMVAVIPTITSTQRPASAPRAHVAMDELDVLHVTRASLPHVKSLPLHQHQQEATSIAATSAQDKTAPLAYAARLEKL